MTPEQVELRLPEQEDYDEAYKAAMQTGMGIHFRSCSCGQQPCVMLKPIAQAIADARTVPQAQQAVCPSCGYDPSKWVTIGTIKVDIENETETFTRAQQAVCARCGGLGGRPSRYGPPLTVSPDGRLSGWTVGGKKDCPDCGGTGFPQEADKCQDCGHWKMDAAFHYDAEGEGWGAALHWFRGPQEATEQNIATLSSLCTCDHPVSIHKETGECPTCELICGPISNEVGQEMLRAWGGDFGDEVAQKNPASRDLEGERRE